MKKITYKAFLVFIVTLVLPIVSLAQISKTDSINAAIQNNKKQKNDTLIANSYLAMAYAYKPLAIKITGTLYADSAISLYNKYISSIDSIKNRKSYFLFVQKISHCYNLKGIVFWELAKYNEAISSLLSAIKIAEKNNLKTSAASPYLNLSLVFIAINQFDKAESYLKMGLSTYRAILNGDVSKFSEKKLYGLKISYANAYNNLGIIYNKKTSSHKYSEFINELCNDSCISAYKSALTIYEELNNISGKSMINENLGALYLNKKDYKLAKDYFYKSLSGKKINEADFKECARCITEYVQSLTNVSEAELLCKNSNNAIKYATEAYTLSIKINDNASIIISSEALAKAYAKTNNYNLAYKYQTVYSSYKDSIFTQESTKQIAEMQTKYETEKKDEAIKTLSREKERDRQLIEEKNRKQVAIIIAVVIFFILSVFIVLIIYRSLRISKRQNNIIQKQKLTVEEKNKDILDSINYAQKIQQALFPTNKYIQKGLNKT